MPNPIATPAANETTNMCVWVSLQPDSPTKFEYQCLAFACPALTPSCAFAAFLST